MNYELIINLPNLEATKRLGRQLGKLLPAGSILLLTGDLGTGKTSLVQGIGEGLGITEPIVSPTFTLINEYFEGRLPLYHLDLYRLEPEEISHLYLENYWQGIETPLGITAIEWGERLPDKPPHYLEISLTYGDEPTRQVTFKSFGQWDYDLISLSQCDR